MCIPYYVCILHIYPINTLNKVKTGWNCNDNIKTHIHEFIFVCTFICIFLGTYKCMCISFKQSQLVSNVLRLLLYKGYGMAEL